MPANYLNFPSIICINNTGKIKSPIWVTEDQSISSCCHAIPHRSTDSSGGQGSRSFIQGRVWGGGQVHLSTSACLGVQHCCSHLRGIYCHRVPSRLRREFPAAIRGCPSLSNFGWQSWAPWLLFQHLGHSCCAVAFCSLPRAIFTNVPILITAITQMLLIKGYNGKSLGC